MKSYRFRLPLLPLVLLGLAGECRASGDPCTYDASVLYFSRPALDVCTTDLPFLDPHNDTQTNLSLLIQNYFLPDKPIPQPNTAWEGSSCVSNTEETAEKFNQAVNGSPLSDIDKQRLIAVRKSILTICSEPTENQLSGADLEPLPKSDFVTYLAGAKALYTGEYTDAREKFSQLVSASAPWLAETSQYLVGRTYQLEAQGDWDGYTAHQADSDLIQKSIAALNEYLKRYPKGSYAASAIGLIRRGRHLDDDENYQALLIADFTRALESHDGGRALAMVPEFDAPWSNDLAAFADSQNAFAVVMSLLYEARASSKATDASPRNLNQALFAAYPGLYEVAVAASALKNGDKQHALELLEHPASPEKIIQASSLSLEAQLLEQLGQYGPARERWLKLYQWAADPASPQPRALMPVYQNSEAPGIKERVASALIRNYFRSGDIDTVLRNQDKIFYPGALKQVVDKVLPEPVLQKLVAESGYDAASKAESVRALLYRHLYLERWKEFAALFPQADDEVKAEFNVTVDAASLLAKNPKDPRGLLDIGYFLQESAASPRSFIATSAADPLLGEFSGKTGFKSSDDKLERREPFDYYQAALQNAPGAKGELRAEVLYRLIRCFRFSYCAPSDPKNKWPLEVRKRWFSELKSKYPQSSWAKELKYYY